MDQEDDTDKDPSTDEVEDQKTLDMIKAVTRVEPKDSKPAVSELRASFLSSIENGNGPPAAASCIRKSLNETHAMPKRRRINAKTSP